MNGSRPKPEKARRRSQNWRRYTRSYSERRGDGKAYVKVDGAFNFNIFSNALLHDEAERQLQIQRRVLTLGRGDSAPEEVKDWIEARLDRVTEQRDSTNLSSTSTICPTYCA